MNNKVYYFEMPDPEGKEMQNKLETIFGNNLDQNDDQSIFFVDTIEANNIFYTLWSTNKVEKIVNEFKILGLNFSQKDITEDVLNGTQFNDVSFSKIFSVKENKILLDLFLKK
jgi:hypothetical protein